MKRTSFLLFTIGALGLCAGLAEEKVDFAGSIQPIFEARCIDCHGPKKQKGDLRLDSREAALKGGESEESTLVPGKSAESALVKKISLPKDHEDIMPPKGEPLKEEQIALIKKWIDEGVAWPEGLTLVSTKERELQKAQANKLPEPEIKEVPVSDAEKKAIATLKSSGPDDYSNPLVMPLAQNSNLIYANFRLVGDKIDDSYLLPLADIKNLSELDLANTKVTAKGVAHIKDAKSLTKLSFAKTGVGDDAMKQIVGLSNLVSLNIYGTKVTDAGLQNLKNMKFLRKVYAWQSGVTEKGATELKKILPNVDVNLGVTLAKVEAKKEEVKQVSFNVKCPLSGEEVDPTKLFSIRFCCGDCLSNFTKEPAKHIAKVKATDNEKCPLSDKAIDESKKFVIGFCCGNCLGKFTKEPAQHIAKVKKG